MGVGRLAVDWDWVVNDRRHPGVLQLLLEPVAAAGFRQAEVRAVSGWGASRAAGGAGVAGGNAHHELVPAVAIGTGFGPGEGIAIA